MHCQFCCVDPIPLCGEVAGREPGDAEEAVGVFLDPSGERDQYMAIFVDPSGHVIDARIENPLHHALESKVDSSWDCPGLRVRSWSRLTEWVVEILIPFDGITPAYKHPEIGDRWVGNFYRLECLPVMEITAGSPPIPPHRTLHASEYFGILEFGQPL